MNADDLVEKARLFATAAHGATGQKRKYTDEPYIVHPAAVARIVSQASHTPEMLAAAWLHDVVEDTQVTIRDINVEFGVAVAALVQDLTDVSKPEDGNRERRKAIDRAHSASAAVDAQTIKLADLIDNSWSITRYDPSFAKVYLREKALLLRVMKLGDSTLWKKAAAFIDGEIVVADDICLISNLTD